MPRDDRFKKVSGVGADFLETARAKAEEFLKELSRTGEDTQERAQGAVDDLIEGGRRGTEQLIGIIRREITEQLRGLGLATKDDLAALEQRLAARAAGTRTAAKKAAATKSTAAKKAAAAKSAAAKSAAAKSAAKRAATAGADNVTAKKTPARKTPAKRGTRPAEARPTVTVRVGAANTTAGRSRSGGPAAG